MLESDRSPVVHGGFADIFLGDYDGERVAIKKPRAIERKKADCFSVSIYHLPLNNDDVLTLSSSASCWQDSCHEALLWFQLSHPNVLELFGVDDLMLSTMDVICMVSPWLDHGDLGKFIQSNAYEAVFDRGRLVSYLECVSI